MNAAKLGTIPHWLVLTLLGFAPLLNGQNIFLDKTQTTKEPSSFVLPYAFPSETLDFAYGVGGAVSGAFNQPQVSFGWAVLGSTNKSYGLYFGGIDFRVPYTERWFATPLFAFSRFTKLRSYQDIPDLLINDTYRAGSNESAPDDFLEGKGYDAMLDVKFRYLLPIAHGKESNIHTYRLDRGLIDPDYTSGGDAFNPWTSGRSYFTLRPFYRDKIFDEDIENELLSASNGVEIGYEWDNRDYIGTPSRGEHLEFSVTRDFGLMDSDSSYLTVEFQASKYISMPDTAWTRQQVLALTIYTADTPTWKTNSTTGQVTGRAPDYMSPKLGGFDRMRAYPFERFNDRSVIYYGAEYRIIPTWNPLEHSSFIRDWLKPDWWQIVPFIEAGRVAPSYNWNTLHNDMKWDAGVGFRFMLKKSVVRVEVAASDEVTSGWVMFGHPF